ncbi:MAG: hypothetical protein AB7P18_05605 [Candidatus Binatia bacterium]
MSQFFAGLDLGQATDYTALTIAEKIRDEETREASYHFRHIERMKLGTSYPQVVAHVKDVLDRKPLKGQTTLALDYTGCGRPVADMFRPAPFPLYAISIHGGNTVTRDGLFVSVPKRDLVAVVQVLLQSGRLKIAEQLSHTELLISELQNFRVKIDPVTSHDSYAAWREQAHDDLVLAAALACWTGENVRSAGAF